MSYILKCPGFLKFSAVSTDRSLKEGSRTLLQSALNDQRTSLQSPLYQLSAHDDSAVSENTQLDPEPPINCYHHVLH